MLCRGICRTYSTLHAGLGAFIVACLLMTSGVSGVSLVTWDAHLLIGTLSARAANKALSRLRHDRPCQTCLPLTLPSCCRFRGVGQPERASAHPGLALSLASSRQPSRQLLLVCSAQRAFFRHRNPGLETCPLLTGLAHTLDSFPPPARLHFLPSWHQVRAVLVPCTVRNPNWLSVYVGWAWAQQQHWFPAQQTPTPLATLSSSLFFFRLFFLGIGVLACACPLKQHGPAKVQRERPGSVRWGTSEWSHTVRLSSSPWHWGRVRPPAIWPPTFHGSQSIEVYTSYDD